MDTQSNPPLFTVSISFLLFATLLSACVAAFFRTSEGKEFPEGKLGNEDLIVLSSLRSQGLDISQSRMCGMGHFATFTISKGPQNKFHVSKVSLKHATPERFISKITEFPELRSIKISMSSQLDLTITRPQNINPNLLEQTLRKFNKLQDEFEVARVMDASKPIE